MTLTNESIETSRALAAEIERARGAERSAAPGDEVEVERNRYGYRVQGEFLRRVTTLLGGIPKGWLGAWAAREVAEYAVQHRAAWETLPAADAVKLLKGAPWQKRDAAGDRGTAVHLAIEAVISGSEIPPDVLTTEDELDCAIQAETFLRRFCRKIMASELTVYSLAHGYAGTLDIWCEDREGTPWIIDAKTSANVYAEHAVQQVAYHAAEFAVVGKRPIGKPGQEKWAGRSIPWGPGRAKRLGVLHVRPDGTTLYPVADPDRLWRVFRAASEVKVWQLDTDDYGGKTPREIVYDPVIETG